MHDEEKNLVKWKEEIEKNEIQDEQLENAILEGFKKAKDTKSKRRFRRRSVWVAITAAILLLSFVTSIRVSPVFANAIASIPGMSGFVEMIQDNKGLQLAVENEHFQAIGTSKEIEGLKVTLEGIITDETTLLAFFTTQTTKFSNQSQSEFRILNLQGEVIGHSISIHSSYEHADKRSTSTTEVEFEFLNKVPSGELVIEYEVREKIDGDVIKTLSIPFQNNLKPIKKEQYMINETAFVEGQKIHIRSVTIGSLRTAVVVEFDEDNTKKILGFEDLKLIDDKGEIWSSIKNGVTASGTDEPNVTIYYLQSNYFKKTYHFTLKFNKLMAIDKDEAYILIDTVKQEIIKQPREMKFSNLKISGSAISLEMEGESWQHYDPFSTVYDINDKEVESSSGWSASVDGENLKLGFQLTGKDFTNPIKLPLHYYPSYINGDVTIKIK